MMSDKKPDLTPFIEASRLGWREGRDNREKREDGKE
jgi:hypothetical protein